MEEEYATWGAIVAKTGVGLDQNQNEYPSVYEIIMYNDSPFNVNYSGYGINELLHISRIELR